MQGEQKPIVVVDETRIDFVFYGFRWAAELGAQVGNLDRLTVFILSLVGDLVGLGLPNPRTRDIHSGELCVPRITDCFDLPERVKAKVLAICSGEIFAICSGADERFCAQEVAAGTSTTRTRKRMVFERPNFVMESSSVN